MNHQESYPLSQKKITFKERQIEWESDDLASKLYFFH